MATVTSTYLAMSLAEQCEVLKDRGVADLAMVIPPLTNENNPSYPIQFQLPRKAEPVSAETISVQPVTSTSRHPPDHSRGFVARATGTWPGDFAFLRPIPDLLW